MKGLAVVAIAAVCILGASGCMSEHYATHARRSQQDSLAMMTKADVIALTRAGVGNGVIMKMIRKSGSSFDLDTPAVIALADSGVADTVIHAMLQADESAQTEERSWAGQYYPADYYWWYGYPYYYSSWYWPGYYGWPGPHYRVRLNGGFHGGGRHR